ncbi:MAG: hypothetical protein ACR2LQ_02870 [Acidimicrobiales bacterium]
MPDRPRELPTDVGGLLGGGDLLAHLDRWVALARSDEAVAARTRRRWLRQIADESASFAGVLVDLAERATPVVVQGVGGRRHRGIVAGIGADFAALRTADGADVMLAFAGMASVRVDGSGGATLGDRDVRVEMALAEALAALAATRQRVLVVTLAEPEGIAGELLSVGSDVLNVRLDGAARGIAYVPIATVAEVRLA